MALSVMKKNNFWNRLRVEKNICYKDLAELFGGSIAKWGAYFSGQVMPGAIDIKHLCELFDVDIETGTAEFQKAHALWKTGGRQSNSALAIGTREVVKSQTVEEKSDEHPGVDIAAVLKTVYGRLPYELFMTFRAMLKDTNKDPLECLYGRISYNEFLQIQRALKDEE